MNKGTNAPLYMHSACQAITTWNPVNFDGFADTSGHKRVDSRTESWLDSDTTRHIRDADTPILTLFDGPFGQPEERRAGVAG